MLHVYGHPFSYPSNMVHMCANALELEHEYHLVNLAEGEQNSEFYLKINPVGKVPAILDEELRLSECQAIIRYLAQKAQRLYPADIQEQAVVDQWISFSNVHIGMAISKILFNVLFAPMLNVEVDERSLADGRTFLDRYLPILEVQLKANPNITGEEMTIADISLLAALDPCEITDVDLTPYPSLQNWRNQLRSRSWYTACHAFFGEGYLSE